MNVWGVHFPNAKSWKLEPLSVAARVAALVLTGAWFFCACGGSEVQRAGDAGPREDVGTHEDAAVEPTSCTIDADIDRNLSVGAGERRCFSLAVTEGGEVQPPSATTARVWLREDGLVCVRAAAVGEETYEEIALEVHCDDPASDAPVVATHTVNLLTRPIGFRPLPAWQENVDGPLAREYFGIFIDEEDSDSLYVYGGFHYQPRQFTPGFDLWRLDLANETWTQLEWEGDGHRMAGFGAARWPGTRTALLFGGLEATGFGFALPFRLSVLDYAAEPPAFTALAPTGAPAAGTYQPALFYDEPRSQFIAVGGQDLSGTHMDITGFDPAANSWFRIPSEADPMFGRPDGRTGFFWAHDPAARRLIAYSGERGGNEQGGCNCADDTWLLELGQDPPRWRRLVLPGEPLGRRNGLFGFDPVNERFFVFGGTRDGMLTSAGLFALELDEGRERWVQIPLPDAGAPPVRSSGAMVFDPARRRMLLGFGNDGAAIYADLWEMALDGGAR